MNKNIKLQVVQDGETDIIVRRSFSHPPASVWRAMTDPALIPKWMASMDPMTQCEMDLRPGGSFYYQYGETEGRSFYFSGPILAVEAPHHLSFVEYFNGDTSAGTTVTTDLVAQGSGTRMTIVMRFASAEARAAGIDSGMTDGFDDVYDKLETLLISG